MSLIGTRLKKHNVLRNESGQAVIEYILVLAITVFLIGTFAYQFSTAFRKYASNYFGEYIACLLETGELPGSTAGQCTDGYTAFNLSDGKTATGGSVGAIGGTTSASDTNSNGSGSSGSGSGSGKKSRKSASTPSSSSSSGSSGETVGPTSSDSNSSAGSSRSGTRKTTSLGSKTGAAPRTAGKEGLKAVGSYNSSTSDSGSNGRGRRTSLGGGFGYAGQEEDQARAADRPASKSVGKNDADHLKPPSAVENPPRAPAAAPDDSGGFTFGAFLRFILIAGIIIAIVILFGGQLLAITKSGEK